MLARIDFIERTSRQHRMVTYRHVEGHSHLLGIPIVQASREEVEPEWSSSGQSATDGVREQRH